MEFSLNSGSAVVRQVLSSSVHGIGSPEGEIVAKGIEEEKKWRESYIEHFMNVQRCMLRNKDDCIKVAQAGLNGFYKMMTWNGKPLEQVQLISHEGYFDTGVVEGQGNETDRKFILPVPKRSAAESAQSDAPSKLTVNLSKKADILETASKWVELGIAEPSVVDALDFLLADGTDEFLPLSSECFIVLGAGSQMGPARTLLTLGATVVAVELEQATKVWAELEDFARSSAGKLIYPRRVSTGKRGADVIADMPQLADWIANGAIPDGMKPVLVSSLYLDGAKFVKVTAASDWIGSTLLKVRPDTVLQSLCSPSETFCVPERDVDMAKSRWDNKVFSHPMDLVLRLITFNQTLLPNNPEYIADSGLYMQNSYTQEQGPSYAFAKLVQRWRTVVAGPSNAVALVAPASLTVSVMHMQLVKMGILGCERFGIVPFLPSTSAAIMTAMLVHSVKTIDEDSNRKKLFEENPLSTLQLNAVHGGTWTSSYTTSSVTKISILVHLLERLNQIPGAKFAGGAAAAALLMRKSKL